MTFTGKMTLEQAQSIAKQVVAARKKWGKHAMLPVREEALFDALTVLEEGGNFDVNMEEVTKLRRQLGAANARVVRLSKRASQESIDAADLSDEVGPTNLPE